jgi:hypothetical protein
MQDQAPDRAFLIATRSRGSSYFSQKTIAAKSRLILSGPGTP